MGAPQFPPPSFSSENIPILHCPAVHAISPVAVPVGRLVIHFRSMRALLVVSFLSTVLNESSIVLAFGEAAVASARGEVGHDGQGVGSTLLLSCAHGGWCKLTSTIRTASNLTLNDVCMYALPVLWVSLLQDVQDGTSCHLWRLPCYGLFGL